LLDFDGKALAGFDYFLLAPQFVRVWCAKGMIWRREPRARSFEVRSDERAENVNRPQKRARARSFEVRSDERAENVNRPQKKSWSMIALKAIMLYAKARSAAA
jgi:hypothetical protein